MKELKNKALKFILGAIILTVLLPIRSNSQFVDAVVALTGSVINEVTKEPVSVFLFFYDENGKKVNAARSNASENGYYYVTGLKPGKKYFVEIKQKNYLKENIPIVIPNTDRYQEISKDFLVKPLEKNIKIKIPVPPFELNKSKLRVGSEDLLSEYVNTLINNPGVKIQILCYPDNDQNPADNDQLTKDRAKTLMDFFIAKGIDMSRISVAGNSKTDPLNPMPLKKSAKGKRYIGTSYIMITDF